MALTPEFRLYDTAGNRQPLPARILAEWDFELLPRGGCGNFNLALRAELDDQGVTLPAVDWRFEVWLAGLDAPFYRGRVDLVRPPIENGAPLYRVSGAGRMARLQDFLLDCAYAKPYGADVSEVYAWIAERFLAGTERLGEFAQAIEAEIGYTVEHASFFGTNVQQAFDRMAEAAQDLLIWGFDVTPGGADRLYVRQRPTTVTSEDYRFRVGRDVQFYEAAENISDLVNALRLIGGAAKAPNLVYNSSFELPRNPGEGPEGNLLENGGFTSGGGWNYTPDADSIEQTSGGEPGEYARTGNKFGEFDDAGDRARQTVTLVSTGVGAKYRLVVHHAKQGAASSPVLHVTLEGLDNSNAVTETLVDPAADPDDPGYGVLTSTARSYQEKIWDVTLGSAATTKLRVTIEHASGGSTLVDDVYLFEGDALINEGWQRDNRGSALSEVDWASTEDPYHGAYCVRVTPSGTDGTGANSVRIRPTRDHWTSVRDKTQHEVKVRARGAAGLKVRLGLQRRGSGGGSDYNFAPEVTLAGTGDWETLTATLGSAGKTEVRPVIELRSNGTYFLDAVEVYEAGVETRDDFLPGEALEYYFRTDNGAGAVPLDTGPDGLSAGAQASIATYGLRQRVLEIDELEDLDQAKKYATGYFNRYAIPQVSGRLVLEPCDVPVRFVDEDAAATPQGMIAVAGARVPIADQFPARIVYRLGTGGALRCELDLTNRRPDPALLLGKQLSDRRGGGGRSGGGGGYTSSPGNSGAGGDEGTAPTWRVNDADAGTRSRLNLKAGAGITLTPVDDEADDEVEVTIAGTVPVVVQEGEASKVASLTALDFGAGFDVTESPAGEANVALDLSEVVTGDLALTGNTALVDGIQGVPVAAPVAGDDEKFLKYDHGTGFVLATPAGGGRVLLGAWARADISTLTTVSGSPNELGNACSATPAAMPSAMPAAGLVETVVITLSGTLSPNLGDSLNLVITNGTTTLSVSFAENGTGPYLVSAGHSYAFAAEDPLTVKAYRSGTLNAVEVSVTLWGSLS